MAYINPCECEIQPQPPIDLPTMSVDANLNPLLLAAHTPDPDPRLLPLLRAKPELASAQDAHGYSLLHAAASYNHTSLLRALVNEFKVDVNLRDEDNETCLFVAEAVDVARCLVEELHIDLTLQNEEGLTALEKIESEEEFPDIAKYLRTKALLDSNTDTTASAHMAAVPNGSRDLPSLPPNVSINVGTGTAAPSGVDQEPDPEFRRRIEELAAKENFHTEEGQNELRELITDAMRDVGGEGRDVRRRVG